MKPITRTLFPLHELVVVESFIDNCGWEFDAPLHFMRPFHRYCITGSACKEVIDERIEDILIDLASDRSIPADDDSWPYTPSYLKRFFAEIRRGKHKDRVWYYRTEVVVESWGYGDDGQCWNYSTEEA